MLRRMTRSAQHMTEKRNCTTTVSQNINARFERLCMIPAAFATPVKTAEVARCTSQVPRTERMATANSTCSACISQWDEFIGVRSHDGRSDA